MQTKQRTHKQSVLYTLIDKQNERIAELESYKRSLEEDIAKVEKSILFQEEIRERFVADLKGKYNEIPKTI